MGQCFGRRVEEAEQRKCIPATQCNQSNDITENFILNSARIKIHVLEYIDASNTFIVLYRNKPAITVCGDNDTSMFIGISGAIVDTVIQRNKTLYEHIKLDTNKRRSNDFDRSVRHTETRFKRAEYAYEAHRKSLELEQSAASPETWYELCIRQFYGPANPNIVIVSQYEITKFIQHNDRLMHMTDQHIHIMQQVYPSHILLKMGSESMADPNVFSNHHQQVGIFFADIVGFTSMCQGTPHDVVMLFLNELYSAFDAALEHFPMIYKYEVAGDCYIVVCGLTHIDEKGFVTVTDEYNKNDGKSVALNLVHFALYLREIAGSMCMPDTGLPVSLHIGIHVGPVTSGVVGVKSPRFMLVGDTMNTASRMESTCPSNKVQVSEHVFNLLEHERLPENVRWCKTTGVNVKGKGFMNTYVMEIDDSITCACANLLVSSEDLYGVVGPYDTGG